MAGPQQVEPARLDDFRLAWNYYSQARPVHLLNGADVSAWVYQIQPAHLHVGPVWTRRAYLDLMLEAARAHRLPPPWIATLQAVPTCDD